VETLTGFDASGARPLSTSCPKGPITPRRYRYVTLCHPLRDVGLYIASVEWTPRTMLGDPRGRGWILAKTKAFYLEYRLKKRFVQLSQRNDKLN